MGAKAGAYLIRALIQFALLLSCLSFPACAWMTRKDMPCPGRPGASLDNKYYCEIGALIEKSFQETIQEAVREAPGNKKEFQGLHAVAEMRLDHQGNLKGIWLSERTNDARFNRAALESLRRVSPLPRPPEELFNGASTVTIFWDFRLTE